MSRLIFSCSDACFAKLHVLVLIVYTEELPVGKLAIGMFDGLPAVDHGEHVIIIQVLLV